MLEKYLSKTKFDSLDDFKKNFKIIVPKDFNFAYDVVDEWAKVEPKKVALCWTNDKGEHIDFTFADMKRETDKTASYFQSLGIKKGDMVMLILKRRYEFWFSIIALHKIGAVVIPATHLLTKKDIVYRANAATIKAIVADGSDLIIKHIEDSLPESPSIEKIISVGPNVPAGWEDFHKGIENAAPFVKPEHPNSNDDISLMYFTSGTTGNPKMVAHSFTYPLGHIVTGKYWHNLHEDSLHLTVADTGWGKAVWGKLYGQWFSGATVFVYDHEKFTPADMLKMIEKYKITSFCAPPTMLRMMIKQDISKYDFTSVRHATTAGEALNPEVWTQFERSTGLQIAEGFGQTETTLSLANLLGDELEPGSMGKPVPDYGVDLVDADGNPVPAGENGEIVIRTDRTNPHPGIFVGYYKDEEKTDEVWRGGFYHTGDLAWRDENGYYHYVGRADDVIKSSGYRIGPAEIENVIMELPYVLECGVSAAPDPVRGQVVKASIVLVKGVQGTDTLKEEVQRYVKEHTAPYKYPRIVVFKDELPKTISGKIQRNLL